MEAYMPKIILENDRIVYNIYTLIDDAINFPEGTSVVICNNSNNEVFISREELQPQLKAGMPLAIGDSTITVGKKSTPIWVSGAQGSLIISRTVDQEVGNIFDLPADVWTSKNPTTRRLSVDAQETGFEEGRDFYCLADAVIPSGEEKHYKFNFNTDIIFEASFVTVVEGDITLEVWSGGTDNGAFLTPIPVLPANSQSDAPIVANEVTKFTGGVYNLDGSRIDYLRIKTDTNSNKSVGKDAEFLRKVGISAGSYYFRFINNSGSSSAEFIIKERWEKRPSQYL